MGHLTPFLRLAGSLTTHHVQLTIITPLPTVSLAESQTLSHFLTSFPQIAQVQLHLLPLDHKQSVNADDPFYYHIQVIRQSSSLLLPLLSSLSPPASALITDMSLAAAVIPITQVLNLPNYIFFTSSAKMLTLFLSYHTIFGSKHTSDLEGLDAIKIPGLEPIPKSWIPPPLLQDKNNLLKIYFFDNGRKMTESSGILVNTSEGFEQETLRKLNEGKVIEGLPSVLAVGPLPPCDHGRCVPLAWLEGQPVRSVVYVSFGSRTGMSREQIRELGDGLVRSGSRFIWVVKEKRVDVEDDEDLDQGGETLVTGAKIAAKIRYVMENEAFKLQGMRFRDEARKGLGVCGNSNGGLTKLRDMLKA
ncbi:hypothetical protein K2173_013809 [Erythroxylum novogranatense]|uniref:Uncharacterized protein n=1 Tax=Erythroxylum novogranatense TaxID=1862640 RepID=A0AAV8SCX1_9ROSI|nr:hypothetical protein K2173_013809 [Erythroxylum novogranatense]